MTPQDKIRALEDVKRIATQYGGIVAVFEEIAKIGSLEQATQEAEKALEALRAKHERETKDQETKRVAFNEEVNRLRNDAERNAARLQQAAKDVLDNAKKKAAAIVDAGQNAADEQAKAAMVDAGRIEQALAARKNDLQQAEILLQEKQAEIDRAVATQDELAKRHAAIKQQIDALKAKLS